MVTWTEWIELGLHNAGLEPLQHNTIEYIHGHYLIMMTCTERIQPGLHCPGLEPLRHNTIEYIYYHYLTLMTSIELFFECRVIYFNYICNILVDNSRRFKHSSFLTTDIEDLPGAKTKEIWVNCCPIKM